MFKFNKKILLSFLLASLVIANNNVMAAEEDSSLSVSDYSYINSVNYEPNTITDVVSTMTYSPNYNNKDISAYTDMTAKERQMEKMQNKYAVLDNDFEFDPTNSTPDTVNVWLRPYASIEKVQSDDGRVKTNTYGVYTGVNSGLIELGHGWDTVLGGYIGYNGAHLDAGMVESFQNGGTVGLEGMLFKGNFFIGGAVSTGVMSGKIAVGDIMGIVYTFINTGVSTKTGYNFELADGKFIIQPVFSTSSLFAHTFNHTEYIEHNTIYDIMLEPGLNFIYKFDNGWQPYAGVSVVWNILSHDDAQFPYGSMQDFSSRCFVKYGLGVRKTWNDRIGFNFQTFVRNGGRTGVGFQGGVSYAFGK